MYIFPEAALQAMQMVLEGGAKDDSALRSTVVEQVTFGEAIGEGDVSATSVPRLKFTTYLPPHFSSDEAGMVTVGVNVNSYVRKSRMKLDLKLRGFFHEENDFILSAERVRQIGIDIYNALLAEGRGENHVKTPEKPHVVLFVIPDNITLTA